MSKYALGVNVAIRSVLSTTRPSCRVQRLQTLRAGLRDGLLVRCEASLHFLGCNKYSAARKTRARLPYSAIPLKLNRALYVGQRTSRHAWRTVVSGDLGS
jgi:hypothetical protein